MLMACVVVEARARTELTTAPHFLPLGEVDRVVFFASAVVPGALATTLADGTIEVTVPGVGVDKEIAGKSFEGNGAVPGKLVATVVASGSGDARILVRGASPGRRARAYAAGNPPRLIIELGAAVPPAAPKRADALSEVARASAPQPSPTPGKVAMRAKSGGAAAPEKKAPATDGSPDARKSLDPVRAPNDRTALPREILPQARGSAVTPSAAQAPAAAPSQAGAAQHPSERNRAERPLAAPSSAPEEASATICRWTRIQGMPFCAPDPEAAVYRSDSELATVAAGLGRGRVEAVKRLLGSGESGARRYLAADRILVERAAEGWLLPAAEAYESALRTEPSFVDAERARLNLALAYWAIGFVPELRQLAARDNSASPLADALLVDLLLRDGPKPEAEERLARARKAGGLAACLGARAQGLAAILAADPATASAALDAMRQSCSSELFDDPASEHLRAALRAQSGDLEAAIARIEWLEREVLPRERAAMVLSVAVLSERAGQPDRARRAYERLAGGEFGSAEQRRGTVALARLDAEQGRLTDGLARLGKLSPDGYGEERRGLMAGVSTEVLQAGHAASAVALMHAENIDPETLTFEQQILLARRYREIGFPEHGARLLLRLHRSRPEAEQPVTLAAEIGENALARSDAGTALAAADAWRARAGDDPGALSLRLRALSQLGSDAATIDQAAAALEKVDPVSAARIRVELARAKLATDPTRARDLAALAVAPAIRVKLPAADAAAALWIHADASERLGDDAAAIAGFRAYVEEHSETPAAAAAGYRLARVATRRGDPKAAEIGYAAAERGDPLTRRVATVVRNFDQLVRPLLIEEKP